ncbi:hypothetical protein AAHA92_30908 [Salvia divinorum]|uniref:Uncharacterized protein n=1 Tax=Salvia divinorum TaxID=28513 RepID=A0ABD1FTC0_SALDI
MEARMDKLEQTKISAFEKTKQPTPTEKCQASLGQEESFSYYGPPAEAEYPAQVYAAGSWNANRSWKSGKQRDAPWRDHPNFRWSNADHNQPAPQAQNFQNRVEGPSSWSSRNPEGTNQLGNQGQGGSANWSGRYQQGNPADSYIPPHQRGFQGGGASQQTPGGQAPNARYNQGHGANESFHPQQRPGYNNYQYQQGNSHFNQGPGYNQYASGSSQPFSRQQQKLVDDLVGDLLNTQQNLHNNIQSNNDVVHKLQDAQKEQKAAMDMLARQLSQIATSISEIRGNEGRIPTTVKMPGKENISSITLQPDEEQRKPKLPLAEEESLGRGGDDKLIKETEEAGDHRKPKEVASEESEETEGKKEVPTTIKENVSVAVRKQKVPTKQSDPGIFTLLISMGSSEITQAMCDLRASINVLPLSVYQQLSGVKMVDAQVVIQLTDCSCIRPEGIIENIIVKVYNFIYPVDFYVIKTGTNSAGSSGILLGRPFLKTAKAIINVFDGT